MLVQLVLQREGPQQPQAPGAGRGRLAVAAPLAGAEASPRSLGLTPALGLRPCSHQPLPTVSSLRSVTRPAAEIRHPEMTAALSRRWVRPLSFGSLYLLPGLLSGCLPARMVPARLTRYTALPEAGSSGAGTKGRGLCSSFTILCMFTRLTREVNLCHGHCLTSGAQVLYHRRVH